MLDFIHGTVKIGDQTVKFPFPDPKSVHKIYSQSQHSSADPLSSSEPRAFHSSNPTSDTKEHNQKRDSDSVASTHDSDSHNHNHNTIIHRDSTASTTTSDTMNYSLVEVLHKPSPESTGIWYNGEIVDAHVSKKGEITGYDIRLEKLVQSGGPNNEATVELVTEKFAADKVRPFLSKEKADEVR